MNEKEVLRILTFARLTAEADRLQNEHLYAWPHNADVLECQVHGVIPWSSLQFSESLLGPLWLCFQ